MEAVDIAGTLAKIAAGGWPAWIVSAILGIVGIFFWAWWNKKKRELALLQSKNEEAQAQGEGKETGQKAENETIKAEEKIDGIIQQNSDAGKQERPKPQDDS